MTSMLELIRCTSLIDVLSFSEIKVIFPKKRIQEYTTKMALKRSKKMSQTKIIIQIKKKRKKEKKKENVFALMRITNCLNYLLP